MKTIIIMINLIFLSLINSGVIYETIVRLVVILGQILVLVAEAVVIITTLQIRIIQLRQILVEPLINLKEIRENLKNTHTLFVETTRSVKNKIFRLVKLMTWFYLVAFRFHNINVGVKKGLRFISIYLKKGTNERVSSPAQYSFILPLILSKIDWECHSNAELLPAGHSYYVSMFLLSFVALSCFFNVIGYFFSIYLLQRYNIKEKYPKLNKILKYYEKTGFIMVILDCIVCTVALLVICISSGFIAFLPMVFKFL